MESNRQVFVNIDAMLVAIFHIHGYTNMFDNNEL